MVESEGSHQHPKGRKPTNHSQFPSTSMQDYSSKTPILPPELINEILLRLPVKPLLKFRSVSKSWLALISINEFAKTHLSLSANNKDFTHHRLMLTFRQPENNLKDCSLSSLFYDDSVADSFDLYDPMKELGRPVTVVGSANGLICVVIFETDFFIWNPSIMEFKKLPVFKAIDCEYIIYGFGYDELHDDYKLVAISTTLKYMRSHEVETKIFSLKGDSLTSIHCFQFAFRPDTLGILVSGKFHWAHKILDWDIISVDMTDGKWGKVEKPCYGEGDFDFMTLGVVGSDLSMFCHSRRNHADFWVMKEYEVKKSWTKMFTFNYPQDCRGHLLSRPFIMSSKGEFLFRYGSAFVIYNPKDSSVKYQKVTNCDIFWDANIYIETLVWPFWQ